MGQRRRRPHPTRADQRRPSNHQTLQRSQIYCDLQWDSVASAHTRPEPTSADQATTRPSNGARSIAIYNGTASPAPTPDQRRPSNQPPDPLTEPDVLRFTMGQRRRPPTPDQSRPAPTKQPPDPPTEPDLLRFTMGQRRRRPHPTRADQRRPSNHQTL